MPKLPPPKETRWKKGQSGNPKGKPKGIKNWSTLVQELLDDEKIAEKLLDKKPVWWDSLPKKNGGNAVVVAMMIRAMEGDNKAANWLRKTGYGDKLDLTTGGREMRPIEIWDFKKAIADKEKKNATKRKARDAS